MFGEGCEEPGVLARAMEVSGVEPGVKTTVAFWRDGLSWLLEVSMRELAGRIRLPFCKHGFICGFPE